jgi:FG-GAP repeat
MTNDVGAPRNDGRKPNGGYAYAFDRNWNNINESWGQASQLFAYDSEVGDQFGYTVALDGNTGAIGARYENAKGSGAGAIYTFFRQQDGVWFFLQKVVDPTGNLDDNLASALDISGRTIIAGSPRDDNGNVADQGTVQIFEDACLDTDFKQDPSFDSVVVSGNADLCTYPVPVTKVLHIELKVAFGSDAMIFVTNTLGQVVATVHNGWLEGHNLIEWRPEAVLPAGTYFLRVDAGDVHEARAIILAGER